MEKHRIILTDKETIFYVPKREQNYTGSQEESLLQSPLYENFYNSIKIKAH